ncbi:hypothetical protein AGMMS4952_07510 [Spirochaetia bacterium]|nr:hypothetical protein AGMMS4952_07510 [Spirochaetia bacterium]
MKKFMNRATGLKALYGFIVGAAVLFAACSNLVSPPPNAGISTTPGTGQVRVSIAGEDFAPARTIYPTQLTLYYVYTFTKAGEEEGEVKTTVDGTFTLETGNWNLTVTAYPEAEHTNLAATGSTAFTVTAGGSSPVIVTLEPEKGTGSGTLTYTVTYPAGAALDSITWKKLGSADPGVDLKSTATTDTDTTLSGTETPVDAGYYVITAALTDGNKTAGKKEVVHIYQNLTTEAVFTFGAQDFTSREPIAITPGNLSQMSTRIASAAAGGGASRTDPILVSLAIDDASLLSGTNSVGADPLHKLFDAIPYGVYVAYDLSGCTFGSIQSVTQSVVDYRQNKEYLVSIILPDTLTTIGNSAFYNCSSLTSVTIGNRVTSIGNEAFYRCSGLTSVIIGNSVTSIRNQAFRGCSGLTSVTIGNRVTSIGEYAFYNCSGMTSVTIPDSVTSIGTNAFSGCSGLTSVTIGDGVTSLNGFSFEGNSNLTSVIIGNSVTFIGYSAFSGCSGLTSVTIGDSVTSIGVYAFSGCSGLTSVTIPDSVTSIGDWAFYRCSGLTSVTIPNSVTSIGNGAFYRCSGLTSVTIPDSVTSIGYSAFSGCSGLTSVTIPDSVTSIGYSVFSGCSGLTSVTIPDSVISIGDSAFDYCSGLTSVTIPDSVTSIGEYAFGYCSGLTTVTIPNSVTSIGDGAFRGCSGMTSITVDNGNTNYKSIDGVLFNIAGTTLLQCPGGKTGTYTIPNGVTSIGFAKFEGCSGLTSVTIPDSVTSIGEYAFGYCSGLTSVTIPDSVTSIGRGAFQDCWSLTTVTIPDSVTFIGEAFRACHNLTSVYVLRETTPLATLVGSAFYSTNASLIIYVPAGVVTGYRTAWSAYADRIQAGAPPAP